MFRKTILFTVLLIVICQLTALAGLPSKRVVFDNGFEAIFVENHSSPMITSIVFVKAGARYENEFNNGSTHFLEHLLFNGTKTKSQEELRDLVDSHGGYINAFTRKDLTAYLVLMPTEYINQGLETQSDQLFNSILPPDRFPKERKIVIEEISMNDDDEESLVDKFHNSVLYSGTPYARPVLGYKHLIETVSREEILEYYQDWYAPNNMISLVIGDFDTEEFIKKYEGYYGTPPAKQLPEVPHFEVKIPNEKKIVTREIKGNNSYINVSSRAPLHSDPDYYAFYVFNELLNDESISPLKKAFQALNKPSAKMGGMPGMHGMGGGGGGISTSIYTQQDFSVFNSSIKLSSADEVEITLDLLNRTMETEVANWMPDQRDIDALIVSEKTSEIYLREKLHYYGFIIAPLMVSTSYDFIDNLTANLEKVTAADVKRVANKYLSTFNYIATVVTPQQADKTTETKKFTSKFLHKELTNGLEVIIKSNNYSEVQAFMVLGKDRVASEPDGKEGITDFVNRMLEKGTTKYSKEELSRNLQMIGSNLTLHDNPYIPYDDRYTSRLFSFIKFETISDYLDSGIELLAEMITNPTFPEDEVENVRGKMMQVLGMKSGSTYQIARDLYYNLMFPDQSYSKPIEGTQRSIGSITASDLKDYHKKIYAPNNMILSIVTNLEPEEMLAKVEAAFGMMPTVEINKSIVSTSPQIKGIVTDNKPMEKKQAYMYIGNPVCAAGDPDAPTLRVAVSILSDRLAENLRERQGLAYRVGAGVSFNSYFGMLRCSMGTGVENYEKAKEGILAEIEKMKTDIVTDAELGKSINSIWGSMLTARLSRINQAFYMAVNQFVGTGYNYEDDYLTTLKKLTAEDIRKVAEKYFDTKNLVIATVGAPQQQSAIE